MALLGHRADGVADSSARSDGEAPKQSNWASAQGPGTPPGFRGGLGFVREVGTWGSFADAAPVRARSIMPMG